jgi:metallo-beta-lactamase class B
MNRREFLSLSAAATGLAPAAFAQETPDWHRPFPSFRIVGNLYYVGTADLAAYVIHTIQGDILINTNFPQDLPLLKQSLANVGLKYGDISIILTSHAHGDHDGALANVKKETGASVMIMTEDVPEVESTAKGRPAIHVDRILRDGYKVELGGVRLVAHKTPGHTPGCTTWSTVMAENDKNLQVVVVGSPNVNKGTVLVGNKTYKTIAEDYVKTFQVLKALPCDVFLGAHGEYFNLKAKYARLKAGDQMAFVDPNGYKAWVAQKEQEFLKEWTRAKAAPGTPKP